MTILIIISSFPIVSTLQLPAKAMAQTAPSEGANVLIDDVIQDLKSNEQQLPTSVNSTSLELNTNIFPASTTPVLSF
jgi:hypothetical protein